MSVNTKRAILDRELAKRPKPAPKPKPAEKPAEA